MKYFLILIALLIITSCNNKFYKKLGNPIINTSCNSSTSNFVIKKEHYEKPENKVTLNMTEKQSNYNEINNIRKYQVDNNLNHKKLDKSCVTVIIDTINKRYFRTIKNGLTKNLTSQFNTIEHNGSLSIEMIKIYIHNPSYKNTYIDVLGNSLYLILEAKNNDKEWKSIEYFEFIDIHNTRRFLIIPPEDYLEVELFNYSGDFETKLRVRFQNGNNVYYSKPFKGFINESQFE